MTTSGGRWCRVAWLRAISVVLVAFVALVGCSARSESGPIASANGSTSSTSSTSSASSTSSSSSIASPPPSTVPPQPVPTPSPPVATSARDRLAVLAVDDRPNPVGTYRREDWPHWVDPDGNGCDARQDALIAWSVAPATVNRAGTCKVVAGSWISPYDGRATNNPSDFDVDHLVPLENAFTSGGWRWTAAQRRAFANQPSELVVASASSNRSKGSRAPNEWRPTDRSSWCAYADGWVAIKQQWSLTVTTAERDALGQMLDTCTLAGPVWPGRG